MRLSLVIASTVLAVSAKAYVTAGSRIQKREVVENPRTLMMTHESPITVEGGGLDDPDQIYDLDVNAGMNGDISLTEIPEVRDIVEEGAGPYEGGIPEKYYRRIFGGESTLGRVTVSHQEGQEPNDTEATLSCYFLTKTDRSETGDPDGATSSNVRYVESEDALFLKSESFGLGTPIDTDRPYDGIECE